MKATETSYARDSRLIYLLAEIQTESDNEAIDLGMRITALLDFLSSHVEDSQVMQQIESLQGTSDVEKLSVLLCETLREALAEMAKEIDAALADLDDFAVRRETTKELIVRLLGNKDVLDVQKKLLTGQTVPKV